MRLLSPLYPKTPAHLTECRGRIVKSLPSMGAFCHTPYADSETPDQLAHMQTDLKATLSAEELD